MNLIRRYLTRRILKRHPIPFSLWHQVSSQLPLISSRCNRERTRLRLLSTLFLHKKNFSAVGGLVLTAEMKITIAAQACLEILYLGLDAFDGWIEIIVYPNAFMVRRNVTDENGVVHIEANGLSGESWQRGPLVLSWADVKRDSFHLHPGHHVVIHEFAHKLDMLTGRANGLPPLHPDMPIEKWAQSLSHAYEKLIYKLEHHQSTPIDAYAATNPAEFFAVMCEIFFTAPQLLQHHCPEVYQQLKSYFRQDTACLPLFGKHHRHHAGYS